MSDGVVNDPEFHDAASKAKNISKAKKSWWQFKLIELFVMVAVFGLLIALLLPLSRRASPEIVHRMQCVNNLKQIALAIYNYEEVYGGLPPAYTVDEAGRRLHSWRTLILPYLEQGELYKKIDMSRPWDDPVNAEALRAVVPYYHCPGAGEDRSTTTYLAVVGPNMCFEATGPRRLEDITDNQGSTLMLIETGEEEAVPWMAPVDADERVVMGVAPESELHHQGGTHACFVGGGVNYLKANTPVEVRRAMMSIAGDDDEVVWDR